MGVPLRLILSRLTLALLNPVGIQNLTFSAWRASDEEKQ